MASRPSGSADGKYDADYTSFLATADGAAALELVVPSLKHYHREQARLSGEYGNHNDCRKSEKHSSSPCSCCAACARLATEMLWLLKRSVFRDVPYADLLTELTFARGLDAGAFRKRYGVARKSTQQAISDGKRSLGARLGLGARPYDDLFNSRLLKAALRAHAAAAGADAVLDNAARPEVLLRTVATVAGLCHLRALCGDTHTPFPWQRVADHVTIVLRADAGLREQHREVCALRAQLPVGPAGGTAAAKLDRKIASLETSIAKRGIDWSGPDVTVAQVHSIVKTVGDVVARWGSDKLDDMVETRVFAHLGQDDNIDAVESKSVFDEVEAEPAFPGQNVMSAPRFETGDLERGLVTRCWVTARYLHPARHDGDELDDLLVALATTHLPASLGAWASELGIDYTLDVLAALAPGEEKEQKAAIVDRVVDVLLRRFAEGARRRRVAGLRARAARQRLRGPAAPARPGGTVS